MKEIRKIKKIHEIYRKPIVVVKWIDAIAFNNNYPVTHEFKPNPCVTIGILFSKTKDQVTIIRDIFGENEEEGIEISGAIVIPRIWIKSIEVIKKF